MFKLLVILFMVKLYARNDTSKCFVLKHICDEVFKSGLSKSCGRRPLKVSGEIF